MEMRMRDGGGALRRLLFELGNLRERIFENRKKQRGETCPGFRLMDPGLSFHPPKPQKTK